MRAEDKELDGPDLERQQRLAESELERQDEEELPERLADEQRDLARDERERLIAAIDAILAREHVVVDMLALPEHELRALEGLQAAVEGRDAKLHQFVYASDRRDLLEQALAVLQPNLAYDDAKLAGLVERVGDLRHSLLELEDSQDELLAKREAAAIAKAAGDAPKPDEVDPDAPKPASTLYGPEVAEPPRPATTLVGPEQPEPAKPPTSLIGPEEPAPPAAVTTLGDPEELAAAQPQEAATKKPWWRRPFG